MVSLREPARVRYRRSSGLSTLVIKSTDNLAKFYLLVDEGVLNEMARYPQWDVIQKCTVMTD